MLSPEIRRYSLSEAFHALAQPITALHCGLEIALARPRTAVEYRKRIEDALQIAEGFRGLVSSLRDVVEADDPGEDVASVDLAALFVAISDALHPVADLYGVALNFRSPERLALSVSKAKFVKTIVFLSEEFVLPSGTLRFEARDQEGKAEIVISGTARRSLSEEEGWKKSARQIRMSAAENYLQALGGSLANSPTNCVIHIPLLR